MTLEYVDQEEARAIIAEADRNAIYEELSRSIEALDRIAREYMEGEPSVSRNNHIADLVMRLGAILAV